MSVAVLNYHLHKGEYFERLVVIKDRRTHRTLRVKSATAAIDVGYTVPIDVSVTNEGAVLLTIDEEASQALPDGTHDFDIMATIAQRTLDGTYVDRTRIVAKGTIEVSDYVEISDGGTVVNIIFTQGEDVFRNIVWKDDTGAEIAVQDAYMQARNSTNTLVLDLGWFASPPNDVAIAALPAVQRGYLAPASDAPLQIHISNLNPIPAGTFAYDLFVQDTAGNWTKLMKGSLVVGDAVSEAS